MDASHLGPANSCCTLNSLGSLGILDFMKAAAWPSEIMQIGYVPHSLCKAALEKGVALVFKASVFDESLPHLLGRKLHSKFRDMDAIVLTYPIMVEEKEREGERERERVREKREKEKKDRKKRREREKKRKKTKKENKQKERERDGNVCVCEVR